MKTKENKIWDRQTKDSWLEQIRMDNPTIGISEYFRTIDESIHANSFVMPTDLKNEGHIFKRNGEEYDCKVGIRFQNEDTGKLKTALDLALENGTEYIHFILPQKTTTETLQFLIENVYLDMLVTRWSFPSNDIMISADRLFNGKFKDVKAFFSCNISSNNDKIIENQTSHYHFDPLHIASWAKTLAKILNEFSYSPLPPKKIIFEIYYNNDFLLNICSARALKLVLNKIWSVFNLNTEIYYEANIDDNALSSDVHANIYKLAAMALSASISGVDFLILPSADFQNKDADIQWLKTSIHAQHILKQETKLSRLMDPTAGSYFIEDLTEQISEKLWLELQEIIKND